MRKVTAWPTLFSGLLIVFISIYCSYFIFKAKAGFPPVFKSGQKNAGNTPAGNEKTGINLPVWLSFLRTYFLPLLLGIFSFAWFLTILTTGFDASLTADAAAFEANCATRPPELRAISLSSNVIAWSSVNPTWK